MGKEGKAIARAHSNIAFIKYWGNRNERLRLPANSSISMNLDSLYTQTTVTWGTKADALTINGEKASSSALTRVSNHLEEIRQRFNLREKASVESVTNIPLGAGIASSAAAFAAMTVAATTAAGIHCDEATLSTLARLGSGSAARSIPSGFVSWQTGDTHETSFAQSIASPQHWELTDVIAIVNAGEKAVSSHQGHLASVTSPFQSARIKSAEERFYLCKQAILTRDFDALARVTEIDSNAMHAVMMTSMPPLMYWLPASLSVMHAVVTWRKRGIPVCYTLDAGPNVHCVCTKEYAPMIQQLLGDLSGVREIRISDVGKGAYSIQNNCNHDNH